MRVHDISSLSAPTLHHLLQLPHVVTRRVSTRLQHLLAQRLPLPGRRRDVIITHRHDDQRTRACVARVTLVRAMSSYFAGGRHCSQLRTYSLVQCNPQYSCPAALS